MSGGILSPRAVTAGGERFNQCYRDSRQLRRIVLRGMADAKNPNETRRTKSDSVSQFALIPDFIYGDVPNRVRALEAVGRPMVVSIKAVRTNITHQNPQKRICKAQPDQPVASCRHQSHPHATTPVVRIDIQRAHTLSLPGMGG